MTDPAEKSAPQPSDQGTPRLVPLWRAWLQWVKAHKGRTLLVLLGCFVVAETLTIPWFGIQRLRSEAPDQTAFMRQRIREAADDGKPLRIVQQWIPLARIPKHVVDAVMVAEDGTFFSHNGFDWYEVQESIEKNLTKGRAVRGGSTITQQLAKNLYLSTSKDPVRKAKEAIITLLLEHYLTKDRILELYLNVIEWGRGVFGIESAAVKYFGKSARSLTLDEAARLAAVIPSPLKHQPNEESRYVRRRKSIVLARMSARRLIRESATDVESSQQQIELVSPVPDSIDSDPNDTTDTDEREANGL